MPKYELKFDEEALREWKRLDGSIRSEFLPSLERRLENPIIESARLSGELAGCFKIKSKKTGYRLIYTVRDKVLIVTVIAIGKRDNLSAYLKAKKRI